MKFLKDYTPPAFVVPQMELKFDLRDSETAVHSRMQIERNPASPDRTSVLQLDGENLSLLELRLNSETLSAVNSKEELKKGRYFKTATSLEIHVGEAQKIELESVVQIRPKENLSCEGLYLSSGMYCSQCEAESFRKITYFIDRPDVMTRFQVRIEADKQLFPVLLSNGNRVESGELEEGRHFVVWQDPHKKPAYLFALVAGDLGVLKDEFVTMSGRKVQLEIFAQHGMQERSRFAMESLKKSMKWDEERFGLEYDLDVFMIVVAHDFNMGAMENKGLNIFNAHYVLADAQTAVDQDFQNVLAVVGHEYFHNWTGNRVTCRDWFQLSLKEGLTVYRDQEFSADHGSAAVKRIDDIVRLRTFQFAEDSGPMAHPVRPQSYQSIDNFYTVTVYEKGAEVIRMIATLIGRDLFRKGMDRYFELFDGQAVTTDDFVRAMVEGCTRNPAMMDKEPSASLFVERVEQFKRWYDYAGTPTVRAQWSHAPESGILSLQLSQILPSVKGASAEPYLIPIRFAALDGKTGEVIVPERMLVLTDMTQTFQFAGVSSVPIVSLARGLSAPIKLEVQQTTEELSVIAANDSDFVNRWEAIQKLMLAAISARVQSSEDHSCEAALVGALRALLSDDQIDLQFKAHCLSLPAESYIAQGFATVDVIKIHSSRRAVGIMLGKALEQELVDQFDRYRHTPPDLSAAAIGGRALANAALALLTLATKEPSRALSYLESAGTMTQKMGALEALNIWSTPERDKALERFASEWKDDRLVMNKWLRLQARNPSPKPLEQVEKVMRSSVFDINNPNNVYNLILSFAMGNTLGFHADDGSGYRFIADQVLAIDQRNPQVASRLVSAFNPYRTYDEKRKTAVRRELSRIAAAKVSENVREVVERALASSNG